MVVVLKLKELDVAAAINLRFFRFYLCGWF